MDLDTGEIINGLDIVVDHDVSTTVTFLTQLLTIRRHYNTTISASNSAGSATSYAIISKQLSLSAY